MRRFFALTVLGLAANFATAGIIPPIPRLPASALKPPDMPDQPAEDPAKLAERITENTKKAGDQLAKDDTGTGTRKTQNQILKDIDALLKQSQNPPPPPMGGGSSPNNDQSNSGNQSQNPRDGQSQGQSGSRGSGNSRQGSGGSGARKPNSGQRSGGSWRERRNSNAGGAQQANKPQPMPKGTDAGQPMPQTNAGNSANPGAGGSQAKAKPDLPLDEAITKQVWGHLPERLRQQMSQYYRERFMPKYGDLLRQYYASLAEREKAAKQP